MNNPPFVAVVTTVQSPTDPLRALAETIASCNGKLVVAGDQKGPRQFSVPHCDFLSLADQRNSSLGRQTPVDCYARKNIAYLHAMNQGSKCIYETDDDNALAPGWTPRSRWVADLRCIYIKGWVNIYSLFTDDLAWPRGLPLDQVRCPATINMLGPRDFECPLQQGLVDGSPDVDAVHRLVLGGMAHFRNPWPIWLGPGSWCPFNSQNTWWWPEVWPLMYLPSHCSFRMTDIWRSFVAQRCLWELGYGVVFYAPDVVQVRNEHNLLRDFQDELPGYLNNNLFKETLQQLTLIEGPLGVRDNLRHCYAALVSAGLLHRDEMTLVDAWLDELPNR